MGSCKHASVHLRPESRIGHRIFLSKTDLVLYRLFSDNTFDLIYFAVYVVEAFAHLRQEILLE